MLIEEALYSLLTAATGVTAIVDDRIFPVTMPQTTKGDTSYPAIVYELVRRDREQTHDAPSRIVKSHFTIHAIGPVYFQVKQLADEVRLAVNGQSAALATLYQSHVRGIFLTDENDDYLFDEVEQLSLFHVPMSFTIQHWEELS